MPHEDQETPSEHCHATSRRLFMTSILGGTAASASQTVASAAEPEKSKVIVNPRLFSFVGGKTGTWTVLSAKSVSGEALPMVDRIDVVAGAATLSDGVRWILRGVTSNTRYTTTNEKADLTKKQVALGRSTATHAALIPIKKSAKWWDLSQDERRAIFEEQSKHTTVGLKYLPAVARRLHHCRDLGESQPFDFLTFFDFAKDDITGFDEMLATMRASEEWKYVEREVDIRLELNRP